MKVGQCMFVEIRFPLTQVKFSKTFSKVVGFLVLAELQDEGVKIYSK